jgi:hypothetical protein
MKKEDLKALKQISILKNIHPSNIEEAAEFFKSEGPNYIWGKLRGLIKDEYPDATRDNERLKVEIDGATQRKAFNAFLKFINIPYTLCHRRKFFDCYLNPYTEVIYVNNTQSIECLEIFTLEGFVEGMFHTDDMLRLKGGKPLFTDSNEPFTLTTNKKQQNHDRIIKVPRATPKIITGERRRGSKISCRRS